MKCKHCGFEIKNDSNFCPFCGEPIKKNGRKPSINKRNIKILAAAGVVLVAAAFTGTTIYVKEFSPSAVYEKKLSLGEEYLANNEFSKAEAAFKDALEIDDNSIDAELGLAETYAKSDNPEKAQETLDSAEKKIEKEKVKYDMPTDFTPSDSGTAMPAGTSTTSSSVPAKTITYGNSSGSNNAASADQASAAALQRQIERYQSLTNYLADPSSAESQGNNTNQNTVTNETSMAEAEHYSEEAEGTDVSDNPGKTGEAGSGTENDFESEMVDADGGDHEGLKDEPDISTNLDDEEEYEGMIADEGVMIDPIFPTDSPIDAPEPPIDDQETDEPDDADDDQETGQSEGNNGGYVDMQPVDDNENGSSTEFDIPGSGGQNTESPDKPEGETSVEYDIPGSDRQDTESQDPYNAFTGGLPNDVPNSTVTPVPVSTDTTVTPVPDNPGTDSEMSEYGVISGPVTDSVFFIDDDSDEIYEYVPPYGSISDTPVPDQEGGGSTPTGIPDQTPELPTDYSYTDQNPEMPIGYGYTDQNPEMPTGYGYTDQNPELPTGYGYTDQNPEMPTDNADTDPYGETPMDQQDPLQGMTPTPGAGNTDVPWDGGKAVLEGYAAQFSESGDARQGELSLQEFSTNTGEIGYSTTQLQNGQYCLINANLRGGVLAYDVYTAENGSPATSIGSDVGNSGLQQTDPSSEYTEKQTCFIYKNGPSINIGVACEGMEIAQDQSQYSIFYMKVYSIEGDSLQLVSQINDKSSLPSLGLGENWENSVTVLASVSAIKEMNMDTVLVSYKNTMY